MFIKSAQERQAALLQAKGLLEGGNLAGAEELLAAAEDFDRRAKSVGPNLLQKLSDSAPAEDGGDSGAVQFLDFGSKSFENLLVKTVREKSLVGAGSQVVGVPLVNADPITLAKPAQSFLQFLPVVTRPSVYSMLKQSSRTPNATVVAPGAAKPVSAMQLVSEERRLKIIATLSEKIGRYVLDDNTNLVQFVKAELQYAIQLALEDEFLNGDGTGEHFTGLVNTSGIQLYTAPAGQTDDLVSIRKALSIFDNTGEEARGVVLNGTDWENIVTKRNTGGNFDLGGAVDEDLRRVWGKPVALSALVPTNTAWVLGAGAANLSNDGKLHFDVDAYSGFTTNEVQFRMESRFESDVTKPSAIVKATFVDA